MHSALEILPKLDPAQLKFFTKRISLNLDLPLNSIFTPEKLQFYEDELGVTKEEIKVLEEFTKYVYSLAAGARSFDPARELMDKIGLDEERYKVFEGVFQENAQAIVDAVKRKLPATPNLVENFTFRVSLPLVQSTRPSQQELTLNQKIKCSYSEDVRNPLATLTFNMKKEEGIDTAVDPILVDLEKKQLVQLFEEVEKIKEHLDKIYGN